MFNKFTANVMLGGVVLGFSTIGLYRQMTSRVFNWDDEICEPPFTSVVMCSLNEEGFIEKALKSLENQNIVHAYPNRFEFILVDSYSEDKTVEIAKRYGWKILYAPKGKLNARHLGYEKAKGEVVISVDCDTFYPCNWCNLVLKWFTVPDVVGVITPRLVDPEESFAATLLSVWMALIDTGPLLVGGMRAPGQSVAIYRQAYFDVGGFDLSINQQNVHEMVREEEIRFAMKLRHLGRVPVEWKAPAFTSLRRVKLIKKNEAYEKWQKERITGERF